MGSAFNRPYRRGFARHGVRSTPVLARFSRRWSIGLLASLILFLGIPVLNYRSKVAPSSYNQSNTLKGRELNLTILGNGGIWIEDLSNFVVGTNSSNNGLRFSYPILQMGEIPSTLQVIAATYQHEEGTTPLIAKKSEPISGWGGIPGIAVDLSHPNGPFGTGTHRIRLIVEILPYRQYLPGRTTVALPLTGAHRNISIEPLLVTVLPPANIRIEQTYAQLLLTDQPITALPLPDREKQRAQSTALRLKFRELASGELRPQLEGSWNSTILPQQNLILQIDWPE